MRIQFFASITGQIVAVAFLTTSQAWAQYIQTNLVSNTSGVAPITDANLLDPWGVAFSTTGPLWVSNQTSSRATVYNFSGASPTGPSLTENIMNLGNAAPSPANGPTGQVSTSAPGITTSSTDFPVNGGKSSFIFGNMDGSISAWHGGMTSSAIVASVSGASFTGLAIGNPSAGVSQIYAADQNSGNIDVFNNAWQQVGTLTDPNLPSDFTAFNVQNVGGTLFATYAIPNEALGGIVDEFSTSGALLERLITDPNGAVLQSPWGVAVAPAGWGQFGGDLLIGNDAGDGTINAYSLAGVHEGQITLNTGSPFSEGNLWSLYFGNGGSAGSPNDLYFSAGLASGTDGLVGAISVPEPSGAVLGLVALGVLAGGQRLGNSRRAVRS
jgi:uncharacterized protein (TIGR03118 family)